ncbi:MAG: hypothetical protein AAFX79_04945 [Planctomycetota bacterium]
MAILSKVKFRHAGSAPLQPHEPVPGTPGRMAALLAFAGFVTCGLASPFAFVASIIALIKRPDWFGFAGLVVSGAQLVVLIDAIFAKSAFLTLSISYFLWFFSV